MTLRMSGVKNGGVPPSNALEKERETQWRSQTGVEDGRGLRGDERRSGGRYERWYTIKLVCMYAFCHKALLTNENVLKNGSKI